MYQFLFPFIRFTNATFSLTGPVRSAIQYSKYRSSRLSSAGSTVVTITHVAFDRRGRASAAKTLKTQKASQAIGLKWWWRWCTGVGARCAFTMAISKLWRSRGKGRQCGEYWKQMAVIVVRLGPHCARLSQMASRLGLTFGSQSFVSSRKPWIASSAGAS